MYKAREESFYSKEDVMKEIELVKVLVILFIYAYSNVIGIIYTDPPMVMRKFLGHVNNAFDRQDMKEQSE